MFANIDDLTSSVISSEKNLPLLSQIYVSMYLHIYPFNDTVWTGNEGPHCINHDEITSFLKRCRVEYIENLRAS